MPNLPWKKHVKYPTRHVKVSYSVLETKLPTRPQSPSSHEDSREHPNGLGNTRASTNARQTRGSREEPRRRGRREPNPDDGEKEEAKVETDVDRMIDDYVNDENERDDKEMDDKAMEKEDEEDEDDYEDEDTDDGSESNTSQTESRTQRTHRNTNEKSGTTTDNVENGNVNVKAKKVREDSTTDRVETSTKTREATTNTATPNDALERITDRTIRKQTKDVKKTDRDDILAKESVADKSSELRLKDQIDNETPISGGGPISGDSLPESPTEESQCLGHLSERVQIRPITALGEVPLVHARVSYKEYYLDRNLIVLISHQPLYPLSRVHIPVFVYKQNVNAFVLR